MKQIRVALSGDRGRMGKSLKKLIKNNSKFKIKAVANRSAPVQDWNPKNIDVVVDFSLPSLWVQTLKWCETYQKPLVSGTTGLSPNQQAQIKKISQKIPIFYAENMSWGCFLMSQWLSQITPQKGTLLLEDIHHKNKKDRPSGTALRLKKSLPKSVQKKVKIKSIRKGAHFGIHRLTLTTKDEKISVEHEAFHREVFAQGALHAAQFLIHKKKGLYSVQDIY